METPIRRHKMCFLLQLNQTATIIKLTDISSSAKDVTTGGKELKVNTVSLLILISTKVWGLGPGFRFLWVLGLFLFKFIGGGVQFLFLNVDGWVFKNMKPPSTPPPHMPLIWLILE